MSPRKDDPKKDQTKKTAQKVVTLKAQSKKARETSRRETTVEYDDSSNDSSDSLDDSSLPTPLTLKEKSVLEFLETFIRDIGISPSYQEICEHFGFASFNSVQRYLKQLEAKGYIRVPGGNQKRALTVVRSASALQDTVEDLQSRAQESVRNVMAVPPNMYAGPQSESLNLPMLGRVAAGSPIEAYEHDEFIDVPASLVRYADRTYALRVQGQSMIEDGILDGDVILVQRQGYATDGEIVVAMIGEEATVKRFYTHSRDPRDETDDLGSDIRFGSSKMIELRPANSNMASLWFTPGEVQIRGIVVGLIRKF